MIASFTFEIVSNIWPSNLWLLRLIGLLVKSDQSDYINICRSWHRNWRNFDQSLMRWSNRIKKIEELGEDYLLNKILGCWSSKPKISWSWNDHENPYQQDNPPKLSQRAKIFKQRTKVRVEQFQITWWNLLSWTRRNKIDWHKEGKLKTQIKILIL